MNIILIPEGDRPARPASFSRWHILVLLSLALAAPMVFGAIAFESARLLSHGPASGAADRLRDQQRELEAQRSSIERARLHTQTHLNAMAQRLGQLQAQILRLNALGERLTRVAGIDNQEFDFRGLAALRGSAHPAQREENGDMLATLDSLDRHVTQQSEQLAALENVLINRQTRRAQLPRGWPVTGGWLSSHYGIRADPFTGRRSHHRGVDIASPLGSSIKVLGDGVVSYAGKRTGYGLMVEVNHGQGYSTRYAHARKVLVAPGDRVKRGKIIATVGSTGRSTGPHLHVEVLKEGRHLDPEGCLQRKDATPVRASTLVNPPS
jgi:murein DD-endopeptidase MepM/ murein hydrolase activator NlpD